MKEYYRFYQKGMPFEKKKYKRSYKVFFFYYQGVWISPSKRKTILSLEVSIYWLKGASYIIQL